MVAEVRKAVPSFHVMSSRAAGISQSAMSTSDVFTLRVMVVGIGVVLATLYL